MVMRRNLALHPAVVLLLAVCCSAAALDRREAAVQHAPQELAIKVGCESGRKGHNLRHLLQDATGELLQLCPLNVHCKQHMCAAGVHVFLQYGAPPHGQARLRA